MKEDEFRTEVELCAAFITAATRSDEWVAYPETWGDILLVRREDGVQIGIEAKLVFNTKVILQAIPDAMHLSYGAQGPDFRAVLVPNRRGMELKPVCDLLGLTVIRCRPEYFLSRSKWPLFDPPLPSLKDSYWARDWHDWGPVQRVPLPDYVPDSRAGSPSPITLSDWKIRAIKMAILIDERPVTRADFKALKLSPTRWMEPVTGWLVKGPTGWTWGPRKPDFRAQHPRNYDEILADKATWMAGLFTLPLIGK